MGQSLMGRIMNTGDTIQQAGGLDGKVGEMEAGSKVYKLPFFLNKCVYFCAILSEHRVLLCQTFNMNSKQATLHRVPL